MNLTGGCFCGAVRHEIAGEIRLRALFWAEDMDEFHRLPAGVQVNSRLPTGR